MKTQIQRTENAVVVVGFACSEEADLLALVYDVNCVCVTFPCGSLGQVWYLIVLIPDLCRISCVFRFKRSVIVAIVSIMLINNLSAW